MIADLLVVCGFAFDPLAGRRPPLSAGRPSLQARMNAGMAKGDELLKETGSGNLVMLFGKPDIEINTTTDGQLNIEIHGLSGKVVST